MSKRKQDLDGIYERSDSPFYWASYTDASGARVRCSTGIRKSVDGRREAEALLAKWRLEVHRSRLWGEQPSRTFEELMLGYLKATARDKKPCGRRRYKDAIRHLRGYFSARELAGIKVGDVRGYVERRRGVRVCNATINRELTVLSAAINYARREWEWEIPNPVSGRKLKEPEGRTRWITRAEAEGLIRAAQSESQAAHLPDFIRVALHTGMRKGEVLGLEWRRVDLQAALVHLEPSNTKTGKRRSVPLNKVASEAVLNRMRFRAQHVPASPWVFAHRDGQRIQDVKRAFASACRRAGITDFRIHDLRHTCAAWLVSAGVPLAEVRDLLGHSTVKMTERYAHLAPENVRVAVSVLEGSVSRSRHVGNTEQLQEVG
ncbi:MAG: tyrosine-type recombinase/integrase [Gammaproteobacteria bacterium]